MPYPSNIYIHRFNAYMYTVLYMSIKQHDSHPSRQFPFLLSERFKTDRVSIVPATVSEGAA